MTKFSIRFSLFLSLLFFVLASVKVRAETAKDPEATLAPYFFIENADPALDSFPLKATNVVTNINGVIAETFVTQTYTNTGKRPIHASYVFPASTKVSVHGMKMTVGDQVVTAKIQEKEEAKKEFEEAKKEGKSASLLEQQRPNVFTMNVANIMPGDIVHIELHYTELLSPADGKYQFVFPTVVGPRYQSPAQDENGECDEWVESPYLGEEKTPPDAYNIAVNLSTGVPITNLSSKSHDIQVVQESPSIAKVTLTDAQEYAGNRDFILDYQLTGQDVNCGLMLQEGDTENFFMLMVQPPKQFDQQDVPDREYIFVLDISGSMYGYPLDTAKDLIRDLVSNLRQTDRFNVILFADCVASLSSQSLPATKANIERAINLIDGQDGGGGTELLQALDKATSTPAADGFSRSVVVITDGYISGEKRIYEHIRQNLDSASFFSFGIGSSVNRYLVEGIADVGAGEAFVVTDEKDAAEMAGKFRNYIQSPLLTDIKINFLDFDAYDIQPAIQPTLFSQKPVIIFGKWRGSPSGTIRLTGKTGKQDYIQEIAVSDVKPMAENSALPYLWARQKVKQLTDYTFAAEDDESIKEEVTRLGLSYSMMTPYTSFIAVVETVRNPGKDAANVKQPSPLPKGVSDLAIGTGYTVGSEPGMFFELCALTAALLYAAGFLFRKRRMSHVPQA